MGEAGGEAEAGKGRGISGSKARVADEAAAEATRTTAKPLASPGEGGRRAR